MFTGEPKEEYVQDGLHKTKIISFLGRTTPIILQNDNGPCPLLAICNILLLRNSLNVSSGVSEASQEKLLSLVAERLIDANSNINDKDTAYIQNQQQNIADAIDLLPCLATGIDVNIKFKRIGDFEFTRECAIFDLLDIPLYHGWIVDPQDYLTADAIGSKSYNALTGELVALETQSVKDGGKNGSGEARADFAGGTTATASVPSPCLSGGSSFDGDEMASRKGEMDETGEASEAVMKLLELEISDGVSHVTEYAEEVSAGAVDEGCGVSAVSVACKGAPAVCDGREIVKDENDKRDRCEEEYSRDGSGTEMQTTGGEGPDIHDHHFCADSPDGLMEEAGDLSGERSTAGGGMNDKDASTVVAQELDSSGCQTQNVEGGEPIYKGGECVLHSTAVPPRGDAGALDASSGGITLQQGELVKSFLKNNASQLTVYGLFCLQDGLKERELCVFFRNNHFSTMFKFEGELYLLVTDLGYSNQEDLVWEKLNEVNGDTLFVTGNFQEFRPGHGMWDRHTALSSTVDYISSVDGPQVKGGSSSGVTSDLQLAIALQQQEFEQDCRKDPPPKMAVGPEPRVPGSGGRGLEGRFKDKCILM